MTVPANSWIEPLPKFLYPVSIACLLDTRKTTHYLQKSLILIHCEIHFSNRCLSHIFVAYKLDVVVVNKLGAYIHGVLISCLHSRVYSRKELETQLMNFHVQY